MRMKAAGGKGSDGWKSVRHGAVRDGAARWQAVVVPSVFRSGDQPTGSAERKMLGARPPRPLLEVIGPLPDVIGPPQRASSRLLAICSCRLRTTSSFLGLAGCLVRLFDAPGPEFRRLVISHWPGNASGVLLHNEYASLMLMTAVLRHAPQFEPMFAGRKPSGFECDLLFFSDWKHGPVGLVCVHD